MNKLKTIVTSLCITALFVSCCAIFPVSAATVPSGAIYDDNKDFSKVFAKGNNITVDSNTVSGSVYSSAYFASNGVYGPGTHEDARFKGSANTALAGENYVTYYSEASISRFSANWWLRTEALAATTSTHPTFEVSRDNVTYTPLTVNTNVFRTYSTASTTNSISMKLYRYYYAPTLSLTASNYHYLRIRFPAFAATANPAIADDQVELGDVFINYPLPTLSLDGDGAHYPVIGKSLTINFGNEMIQSSLNTSNITINNGAVISSIVPSSDGRSCTIGFQDYLKLDQDYTVTLQAINSNVFYQNGTPYLNAVRDITGMYLPMYNGITGLLTFGNYAPSSPAAAPYTIANSTTIAFHTVSTFPALTAAISGDTTQISTLGPIQVSFSNEMDQNTVTKENITISDAAGNAVDVVGTVTLSPDKKSCRIDFSGYMDYEKDYKIIFSNNVKDIYKQGIPTASKVLSFHTEVPPPPVIVQSVDFSNENGSIDRLISGLITGTVSIKSAYSNNHVPQKITLVMILYNGDKLEKLSYQEKTLAIGVTEDFVGKVNVPNLAGGNYSIKVYVWDSLITMNGLDIDRTFDPQGLHE